MAIKFEPKEVVPKEEKTYKVGDTFLHKNGDPYIIMRVRVNDIILAGLIDGDRYRDPIKVTDDNKITQAEFDELTFGESPNFTQKDFELKQI